MKKLKDSESNAPLKPDHEQETTRFEMDEHKLTINEIVERYETNLKEGLTTEQIKRIQQRDGPNVLTKPKHLPRILNFFKHVAAGFNLLLLIASFLTYIVFGIEVFSSHDWLNENLFLATLLLLVVLSMGSLTYYQEAKASQVMASFSVLVPHRGRVLRNGVREIIPAIDVVVGDVVFIEAGDRIPCDIYLVEANAFKVDNSSLTGESEPQIRSPGYSNHNPFETKNVAFFSTFAVEGSCCGVAIRTGDTTAMGRVAYLTSTVHEVQKPIARDLDKFVKILSCVSVVVGILCYIVAILHDFSITQALILMISLFVGSVPDGLMPSVVIALMIAVKRLRKKSIVVKNMESVETLGSTTVICSDKTGTLTQNRMTVGHLWYDKTIFETNTTEMQTGTEPIDYDVASESFKSLIRVVVLCSRAEFKPNQESKPVMLRETVGDASESALLKFATLKSDDKVHTVRLIYEKVCEIPFSSLKKFQVSIHEFPDTKICNYILVMKGAPEQIIDVCSTIEINGKEVKIDQKISAAYQEACHQFASAGERVLGSTFCHFHLPSDKYPKGYKFNSENVNFPMNNLSLVGLISLVDPPRENVHESVLKCRNAGIKVVMVTGDHPITAQAIALQVGIISEESTVDNDLDFRTSDTSLDVEFDSDAKAGVIHGQRLRKLNSLQMDNVLVHYKELVFARTSPQDKLLITMGFQRIGQIVAVTGDGVNDAPALKKADIGVAMGLSGSEVSKIAADVILMNDNFASITDGIEQGRLIYDNLKKTIAFGLTTALNHELAAMMFYIFLAIPMPIGTTQMLLVGLGTDIFPAISLSFERPESDIMLRKPRNPRKEKLVSRSLLLRSYLQIGVIETAGAFFSTIIVITENGFFVKDLIGIQTEWNSAAINDLTDSYGQEWTYEDRKVLEYTCHTTFFVACVILQVGNLLVNKCRRNSLLQQGMRNHALNLAIVCMLLIAVVTCYAPYMTIIHMYPLKWQWWFNSIPFFTLMIVYDEIRRYLIRKFPGTFIENETYV